MTSSRDKIARPAASCDVCARSEASAHNGRESEGARAAKQARKGAGKRGKRDGSRRNEKQGLAHASRGDRIGSPGNRRARMGRALAHSYEQGRRKQGKGAGDWRAEGEKRAKQGGKREPPPRSEKRPKAAAETNFCRHGGGGIEHRRPPHHSASPDRAPRVEDEGGKGSPPLETDSATTSRPSE